MVKSGLLKLINLESLIVTDSISELFQEMKSYTPQPAPKWLNKERL